MLPACRTASEGFAMPTFDLVPSDVEGFMDALWEFQSAFHDCFARSEPRAHFFDYPYSDTCFSFLSLAAFSAKDRRCDGAVASRRLTRGRLEYYTSGRVIPPPVRSGAVIPSALALFFPNFNFQCHRKKCASMVVR